MQFPRDAGVSVTDLDAAVGVAIITREQADGLLRLSAERAAAAGQADNESLRLISSFNDIFVTIGIVLFIGALVYLLSGLGFLTAAVIAAAAWLLAELFTRVKRLALPSIVLLLIFVSAVFILVVGLISPTMKILDADANAVSFIIPGLATTAAAVAHWLRFHVPITVAAGAAALVVVLTGLIGGLLDERFSSLAPIVFLISGLMVFALAMRFDMADRARLTRRTDVAFWLHLLAAPLIVHPLVWHMAFAEMLSSMDAVLILGFFLLLGAIALIIDRRALLVSSLSYLIYAAGRLISFTPYESSAFAVAVLVVGAVVLVLSIAWRPLRAGILGLMPAGIAAHVPAAV